MFVKKCSRLTSPSSLPLVFFYSKTGQDISSVRATMGQQTSFFEFSQEIAKLHNVDCKLTSDPKDPVWKILFLSPMTDEEICSFFNFDDVRKLRRYHPDRLALVLFKCIEQLVDFSERGDLIVDYCSVMNALRMLGNALPYCYEDLNVKGTEVKDNTIVTQQTLSRQGVGIIQQSPFAEKFYTHFFWENRTCEGVDLNSASHVSVWASGATWHREPLGNVVVRTLTKLCFVPRFTVGELQRLPRELGAAEMRSVGGSTTPAVTVYTNLLWYNSTQRSGTNFRQVDPRRIHVLRTLIQCLSWNVFQGNESLENPFLSAFVDDAINPLAPTLCMTLVNRVITHYSKGTLPYTSYVGADSAEKILAHSLSLLAISFDHPHAAVNCFVRVFKDVVDKNQQQAEQLVLGLHRVIDNPLFASKTMLKDSQKVVSCTLEALVVMFHLLEMPNLTAVCIKSQRYLLTSLLFYVQECARLDSAIHEMQCVLFILLRLSVKASFLKALLNESISAQPPLFVLPDMMRDGATPTYADVLVLMLCFVVSPASPQWFLPLFPVAATIFANVLATADNLTELTCFEVHHAFEFLCNRNVLRRGAASQRACQLWVEGIVSMAQRSTRGCLPLLASLGVSSTAKKLQQLIRGDDTAAVVENAAPDADPAALKKEKKPIKWIDKFEDDMPLSALVELSEDYAKRIGSSDAPSGVSHNKAQLYENLALQEQGLAMPPVSAEPLIRAFVVTGKVRHFFSGTIWRALHKANLRPPLFDFQTVKLY